MKWFECLKSFKIVTFIPMEAIKARKPTVDVFPHEIMLVCLMASMQDLRFTMHNIICYCGVLLHFLGHCALKRTKSHSRVPEDAKGIFQD